MRRRERDERMQGEKMKREGRREENRGEGRKGEERRGENEMANMQYMERVEEEGRRGLNVKQKEKSV